MQDTETRAKRVVEGGELYLRRQPGARWEVNFWERNWLSATHSRRGYSSEPQDWRTNTFRANPLGHPKKLPMLSDGL